MDRKADGMCSKGTTLLIRISRPTSTIKVTQKHVTTTRRGKNMYDRISKTKTMIAVLVIAMMLAGSSAFAASRRFRVAYVSCYPVDSAEWLQALVSGLKEYAKKDNFEIKIVEASDSSGYEPKIQALAESGYYDLIITSYDFHAPATISVAKKFPNQKFAILDAGVRNIEQYKNIQEFKLDRLETAYLAGCVAGLMTKTGKVGMVGGADMGVINEIIAGWQQGLRKTNPNVVDLVVYANSFSDPSKGKELGLSLAGKGCDIIASAAGGTGVGAAQAAAEAGKPFVAWDVHYPDVLHGLELGSAVNYFEVMFRHYINSVRAGNYRPGTVRVYGIAERACDFEFPVDSPVPDSVRAEVEKIRQEILDGKIRISPDLLHK
jgi:basic membrane protein A